MIIAGDINNLKVDQLLQSLPDLKNLVVEPTHGNRVLDVILSDAHADYDRAIIGTPIGPDVAGVGVPSDHKVAIARPIADAGCRTGLSRYAWRIRRTLTAGSLMMLSICLATMDWAPMYDAGGIDSMVDILNNTIEQAVNQYCPTVSTRVRLNDRFFVSARLAELSAAKNKEYRANKNSPRFRELRHQVKKRSKTPITKELTRKSQMPRAHTPG